MSETLQRVSRKRRTAEEMPNSASEPGDIDLSRFTSLGPKIRALRLARGLSQDLLAAPHFTKSYISAVERNKVRPSLKALEALAQRLNVPLPEILMPAGEKVQPYQGNDQPTLDQWAGAMQRVTIGIVSALAAQDEAGPRMAAMRQERPDFASTLDSQGTLRGDKDWYTWAGEMRERQTELEEANAQLNLCRTEYNQLREARPDLVWRLKTIQTFIPLLPAEYEQFTPPKRATSAEPKEGND